MITTGKLLSANQVSKPINEEPSPESRMLKVNNSSGDGQSYIYPLEVNLLTNVLFKNAVWRAPG